MTDAGQAPTTRALRSTRQRAAVSAMLDRLDDFRSAQEIHEELRRGGEGIGLTTVYRTLQTLADGGEVDVLRTGTGEAVYRRCTTAEHHHHLVCRRCGAVVDVDCAVGEAPCLEASGLAGFRVDEAELTFWGLCPSCQPDV